MTECNFNTRFFYPECFTDDEIDHAKIHKNYIITINQIKNNVNKSIRYWPPVKDNNYQQILNSYLKSMEDISPLSEIIE